MPDDRFENRIRAIAQQLSRSISDVDLDGVADRFGVDRDRVRGVADAAQDWLSDRTADDEPLFGQTAPPPAAYEPVTAPADGAIASPRPVGGPHPLDVATELQGRALSALESGRWTLRPGAGKITGTGVGPEPPEDADLPGELRARDWIAADGTPTLVGHQALLRWCATASPTDQAL